MLLFVTKALTGIPIDEIVNGGWPFLVILLLLAIAPFLQIALRLPKIAGYRMAG